MIKREAYLSRIRPFIGKELIKVLTGIRRCGKSVMLQLIQGELVERGVESAQIVHLNFEDMNNAHLCTAKALHGEITNKIKSLSTAKPSKIYLFFDEIQEVENWEICINSLCVEYDCDIYITGSNAKLLSGELATYLAGRYVEFEIYPFSFKEFTELYLTVYPGGRNEEIFRKYITCGGMPYLSNLRYEEAPSNMYLQDIFNSVILKDIVARNSIRDVGLLQRVITYIIMNVGNTFSPASLAKFFRGQGHIVAPETIMNYIGYCIDAFLFCGVRRKDIPGKKELTLNEKYYITDHGLREAVYGGNMRDINIILENIVYMELIRRGYNVNVGKYGTREIDFVCENRDEKIYIQVSYLLASEETIKREFGAYELIRDNFPKYVITFDDIDMSRKGIKHINIRDFLLADDWK